MNKKYPRFFAPNRSSGWKCVIRFVRLDNKNSDRVVAFIEFGSSERADSTYLWDKSLMERAVLQETWYEVTEEEVVLL